jgi:hypothetical protein
MSKRWVMVAGALLLPCAAPPAVMAAAESMVTVTLGQEAPTAAFGDVAKSGTMAGLSAGYRVTRWLATGVDLAYFRSVGAHDGDKFDVYEPSTNKIVNVTLAENWTITELGLYAKAFLLERGRFSPYVRAGAGAYTIRYTQDVAASSAGTTVGGFDEVSKFGVSCGGGLRMRVVGGTSLGVEALVHRVSARQTAVSLWTIGLMVGFGPTGN